MPDGERSSIWTIPRGEITTFFAFFIVFNFMGLGFISFHEIFVKETENNLDIIRELVTNAGVVAAGAAGMGVTASETTRFIVVIAGYANEKWLKPLKEKRSRKLETERAEGRTEGRAEVMAEVKDWNARRLEAEQRGDTFDEPPPGEEQSPKTADGNNTQSKGSDQELLA